MTKWEKDVRGRLLKFQQEDWTKGKEKIKREKVCFVKDIVKETSGGGGAN